MPSYIDGSIVSFLQAPISLFLSVAFLVKLAG